jgi:hypothetical protein
MGMETVKRIGISMLTPWLGMQQQHPVPDFSQAIY